RRLFASAPRAGSRSTSRTSPRRTRATRARLDPVTGGALPRGQLPGLLEVPPGLLVGRAQVVVPQRTDGLVHSRGPRQTAVRACEPVQELAVLPRKADTELHTVILPVVLPGYYRTFGPSARDQAMPSRMSCSLTSTSAHPVASTTASRTSAPAAITS